MKRSAVVGIAITAASALAIGAGVVGWTLTRPPSLEDAVEGYLSALADGDLARLAEVRLPDTSNPDAERTLTAAFSSATEYISEPKIEEVTTDSARTASARARVELGGGSHTIFFGLTLADGRWMVDRDYAASLEITTTLGDAVHVGDALVSTDTNVSLLPAKYLITAAPAQFVHGDSTVVATNEEPLTTTVTASVTSDATAQAQKQLDAYAGACTEPATTVPENCGIRVPWAADLVSLDRIAFRIEKYPVASIPDDGATFAATGGVLVATATGTSRAGGTASFTYRADDWALRGTVTFTGNEMVLAVG